MRAVPASRYLGHQHRVDFVPLGEGRPLLRFGAIELAPDSHSLALGARGEGDRITLLMRAGRVGGGDPAVEDGAL